MAKSSRYFYKGLFERRSRHRYALGQKPYLSPAPGSDDANEDAAISYVVLNMGPIARDVGTAQNHLQATGYFREVREGVNSSNGMVRLQNLMRGARRGKGPTKRKMPVAAGDLNKIYDAADWQNPDSVTLRRAISIAWFSMLRMGGYLEKNA